MFESEPEVQPDLMEAVSQSAWVHHRGVVFESWQYKERRHESELDQFQSCNLKDTSERNLVSICLTK